MNKKVYLILLAGLMIFSYYGQKYTVFKYLEVNGIWPPSLLISGVIFLISVVFLILSLAMINKAEAKQQVVLVVFWTVCLTLVYPWSIKATTVWFH